MSKHLGVGDLISAMHWGNDFERRHMVDLLKEYVYIDSYEPGSSIKQESCLEKMRFIYDLRERRQQCVGSALKVTDEDVKALFDKIDQVRDMALTHWDLKQKLLLLK